MGLDVDFFQILMSNLWTRIIGQIMGCTLKIYGVTQKEVQTKNKGSCFHPTMLLRVTGLPPQSTVVVVSSWPVVTPMPSSLLLLCLLISISLFLCRTRNINFSTPTSAKTNYTSSLITFNTIERKFFNFVDFEAS